MCDLKGERERENKERKRKKLTITEISYRWNANHDNCKLAFDVSFPKGNIVKFMWTAKKISREIRASQRKSCIIVPFYSREREKTVLRFGCCSYQADAVSNIGLIMPSSASFQSRISKNRYPLTDQCCFWRFQVTVLLRCWDLLTQPVSQPSPAFNVSSCIISIVCDWFPTTVRSAGWNLPATSHLATRKTRHQPSRHHMSPQHQPPCQVRSSRHHQPATSWSYLATKHEIH